MYQNILTELGLTANEAVVYEYLLKNGESPAGDIIKKTPLKRGVVYNALNELVKKELVFERTRVPAGTGHSKNKIAFFSALHPDKLREKIEDEERQVTKAKHTLDANIASMISDYNLASGKPGIRIYEGLEGIKKVLMDTILDNPQKDLRTFSDVAGYMKYLKKWNQTVYAPKRKELQVFERVIIPDHPDATEYMSTYIANEITDILFIKHKLFPFASEFNAYNNKIAIVTFSEKTHIGMIIDNTELYETLRSIFDFAWNMGKEHLREEQPEWLKKQMK